MQTKKKSWLGLMFMILIPVESALCAEAADYVSGSSTLSLPIVKVNGSPTFKNGELYLNFATQTFEVRNVDPILAEDIINIDQVISLAQGTHQDFIFNGISNVPVLIQTESNTSGFDYRVKIFDSSGFKHVDAGTFRTGIKKIDFTPTFDDDFTLRIESTRGLSNVAVIGTVLTQGPLSLRNAIIPVNFDQGYNGTLADNAFDRYQFQATANSPVIINTQRLSGNMDYKVKIFNPAGILLEDKGIFRSGLKEIIFTPTTSGAHIIRIDCTDDFGDYVLSVSGI